MRRYSSSVQKKRIKERDSVSCLFLIENATFLIERFIESSHVLIQNKLGIVYADLNGLKTVNDNDGHEAGDKLLKHAAELLNETFGAYEIYRAGGDEFVVFCPDISEETLSERIIQLKKLAEDTADVSFAIGYGMFESDYDIINSMQLTDERMYDDKKEYYKLHPDKNRHK